MTKKIAFLFLTLDNVNFPQIWDHYLDRSKCTIYCHPKYPENVTVSWMKENIINDLVPTGWGYIVGAYQNLLKAAYANQDNYKFITISESCLPLTQFDKFYDAVFSDNINTSYIKYFTISKYDQKERIEVNPSYQKYNFVKHYARFCLSRYHVEKLLSDEKKEDFEFFKKMHIGDEFFLSMLDKNDHIVDFAVTYDNWEYVKDKRKKVNKQIENLFSKLEKSKDKIHKERLTNEIDKLRILRDDFSKNPKSYTHVTTQDIKNAKSTGSFFWRKFPKNSNVEKFYEHCCLKL